MYMYQESYEDPFSCSSSSSDFCGIPMAEKMLSRGDQFYYPQPPRNRTNYSGYNSIGNVTTRLNRGTDIRNIEDNYYHPTGSARGAHTSQWKQGVQGEMFGQPLSAPCSCKEQLARCERELAEVKQQQRIFVYFLLFVIVVSLMSKSDILKDLLHKSNKAVYDDPSGSN